MKAHFPRVAVTDYDNNYFKCILLMKQYEQELDPFASNGGASIKLRPVSESLFFLGLSIKRRQRSSPS